MARREGQRPIVWNGGETAVIPSTCAVEAEPNHVQRLCGDDGLFLQGCEGVARLAGLKELGKEAGEDYLGILKGKAAKEKVAIGKLVVDSYRAKIFPRGL